MEKQKIPDSQHHIEEEQSQKTEITQFHNLLGYSNQVSVASVEEYTSQWDRIEGPETDRQISNNL